MYGDKERKIYKLKKKWSKWMSKTCLFIKETVQFLLANCCSHQLNQYFYGNLKRNWTCIESIRLCWKVDSFNTIGGQIINEKPIFTVK